MRQSPSRLFALALAALVSTVVAGPPAAASSTPPPGAPDDPLAQTIDAGQQVATGPAELSIGHVDIGPRLAGDDWALMVHDDSVVPSVWRSLDDAVIRVVDAALLTVPDDPTYEFLGVEPGTDVHVVPQVQNPAVVWMGWNTQEPNVLAATDRGVTLTLLGVEGPGTVTVFLQAGNLSTPDVLWQSTDPEPQPLWVEVNTHTHANWVFAEPGIYLMRVEAAADLIDGRHVSDVATLRFAVGDVASVDEARAAVFPAAAPDSGMAVDIGTDATNAETGTGDDAGADGDGSTLVIAIVAVAAVLAVGVVVVVVVRGGRAKRRAEEERIAARYRDGGEP